MVNCVLGHPTEFLLTYVGESEALWGSSRRQGWKKKKKQLCSFQKGKCADMCLQFVGGIFQGTFDDFILIGRLSKKCILENVMSYKTVLQN